MDLRFIGFDLPQTLLEKVIFSLITLLVTLIVSMVLKKGVDVIVHGVNRRLTHEGIIGRTKTLRSLFKNIIDIALFLPALLIILAHWDINIMPILTGAGILGLAISFGAQTLVKDVISGVFIILEDQFSVGDKVKIDKVEGVVEQVTLRLTVLRDKQGHQVYIPNSKIETVVRYNTRPRIEVHR